MDIILWVMLLIGTVMLIVGCLVSVTEGFGGKEVFWIIGVFIVILLIIIGSLVSLANFLPYDISVYRQIEKVEVNKIETPTSLSVEYKEKCKVTVKRDVTLAFKYDDKKMKVFDGTCTEDTGKQWVDDVKKQLNKWRD